MTPLFSLATAIAAAGAPLPAPSAPVEVAAPPAQGVTVYPPAFFATANVSTALDMVNRLPGFSLDTGASVRGFEGAAGNVLVDGARPTTKSDPLDQLLLRIPASQVDHIEVIRGGAPGVDMQGKSILANVVRKKTQSFRGLVAIANNHVMDDGRDRPGLRLEGSGPVMGGAFEGGVRYGTYFDDGSGDGPHLYQTPGGTVLRRSDVHSQGGGRQYEGNAAYETTVLGGKLRVNGRYFHDLYTYDETNLYSLPPGLTEIDHDRQRDVKTEFGGRYARALGAKASLELVALRQTEDLDFSSQFIDAGSSLFTLQKNTVETIGRAVLKVRPSDRLSLEAGAETARNTLDSHTDFNLGGVPVALPAASVEVEEKRSEAFAKGVWTPSPRWTLEAGLRYELSSISSSGDVNLSKDLHYAKPRIAVAFVPREGAQIRARIEREVGQLNFDDFVASSSLNTGVVTTGNPDLNPEQAWVGELAFEQSFWGSGSAGVTLRHYEIKDAVDRAPVFTANGGVFDAPANIGDATKDEAALELSLPLSRLGVKGGLLRGSSTWRWTEVTDPTTGDKREISGLKPLEWEAHFSQDLPAWNAVWGIDTFGAWRKTYYRFNQISTDKLKTWATIYYEYKPRPDLVMRAELSNFTERGFRHTRYDFAGPRGSGPPSAVDDRDIQFGRGLYMRIRKSFG